MANRILRPNMGRTAWNPGQKPPYGARLNPHHPLSQGLVGAWLFNEGGGKNTFNLVDSFNLAIQNATWGRNGLQSDATNEGAVSTAPSSLRINVPLTISIGFTTIGTPTGYSSLFGIASANTDSSPYYCYSINYGSSSAYELWWNNLGTYGRLQPNVSYSLGKHQINGVINNQDQRLYLDNLQIGTTGTAAISSITYYATSEVVFGNHAGTSRTPQAIIHYAYIHNRVLTTQEITSLNANPYQMFEWPLRDYLIGISAEEDFSGWSDLIKNTLKLDYGASVYAGDQLRKTGKYSVGSFPSVGTATKKTTKTFGGIWSSVADLIAQLVGAAQKFYQDCISVLTPAGAVFKITTHNFSGALTSIGTVIRKGIKSLAGTTAYIGDITKFIGKKITRTLSTLGELLAQKSGIIYQVCSAGLTFSAQSIKSSTSKLSGAIQNIGALIKKTLPKSFSGILNSSAKIIRMPIKLATGTANFIGTISRFTYKKIIRTFTTIGDILTQKTGAIYKSLAAGLTFSGNAIKSYSTKLSRAFQVIGAIIKKPLKIVKGGFTTAAAVARLRGRILTAILSSTGTIYRKTFTELKANLNQSGSLVKSINIILISIKSFIGDLLTRVFRTIIGILHHRTYFVPFMDREILLPTDGRTYIVEKDDNTYEINE